MKQILIQKPQWGRLASFTLLIMCLPLISCNTNKASENKESSALTDSIKEGLIAKNDTIEEESADKTDYAATQNEADLIPILIPGGRYDPGTLETAIDKTWMEFYRDTITGDYHVDKAQYVISSYYDDCLELNQGGLDSQCCFCRRLFIAGCLQIEFGHNLFFVKFSFAIRCQFSSGKLGFRAFYISHCCFQRCFIRNLVDNEKCLPFMNGISFIDTYPGNYTTHLRTNFNILPPS